MSKRQLAAIKLLGWRYSPTRDAWVHRILSGRVGPVFQAEGAVSLDLVALEAGEFESLFALSAIPRLPAEDAEPLPLSLTRGELAPMPVEARLAEDEPPRLVHVDGRPPTRGIITPKYELPMHGKVVPIQKARVSAWG